MSQITGIERLTYIVEDKRLQTWAFDIYRDGLGGRISSANVSPRHIIIDFPEFQIELKSNAGRVRETERLGDHFLSLVSIGVEDIEGFKQQLAEAFRNAPPMLLRRVCFVQHELQEWGKEERQRAWLKRVDHLTFPVPEDRVGSRILFWEMLGGVPDEQKSTGQYPDEELVLQGVMFENKSLAKKLGIALVAGIDGATERAQVVRFLDANGLDQVQHVAFDVGDMETFWPHFLCIGGNLLDDPIIAPDGAIQAFGWPYSGRNAAEGQYPEFLDRLKSGTVKFQQRSLEGLHAMQIAASKLPPKPLFNCFTIT